MSSGAYVPDRGDFVWLSFDPQAGHEQAGRRPAIVLSKRSYNASGLALLCPITSQSKGYAFELPVPPGRAVTGVILTDQVRSTDWRARRIDYIARADEAFLERVLFRAAGLLH